MMESSPYWSPRVPLHSNFFVSQSWTHISALWEGVCALKNFDVASYTSSNRTIVPPGTGIRTQLVSGLAVPLDSAHQPKLDTGKIA